MIQKPIFAAILGLFLAAAPAVAQPRPEPNCRDDNGLDRCAGEQQRRVRTLFGVRSIEEHQAAGDQVRRVFYVDGYGRDLILIAFVRAPGRDPTLWVHFRPIEGQPRPEPLQAPVPQAVWDEVIERSENFDRTFAPRPGEISLCGHAWVYTIEATGLQQGYEPAVIRRKTEDACGNGAGAAYAREIQRLALPLLPHCAALDPEQHRNPASMLDACRMLHGDRLAAAEVLNLARAFISANRPADASRLDGRFAYDAVVDWNGSRNEARGSAAAFWTRKMGEDGRPSIFFQSVDAESADRVRLTAALSRSIEVPEGQESRYERAPAEQIWVRDINGEMRIERVTVGRWLPSGP